MLTSLPNVLTLSRIGAVPLVVVLAAIERPSTDFLACVVFGAAALTDFFDGRIARWYHQQSDLGRMFDPIADKLLVGASLMMLAGAGRLGSFTLYPAIIILLREILVSGLREYLAGVRAGLPVTPLAKWKTTAQMAAICILLGGDPAAHLIGLGFLPVTLIGSMLLWLAALLTLVTGWGYLVAGLSHVIPGAGQGPLPSPLSGSAAGSPTKEP